MRPEAGLAFFDRHRTSDGPRGDQPRARAPTRLSGRNLTNYVAATCSRPAASGINYAVPWGELVWRAGFRQHAFGISPMWLPSSSRMTFVRVALSQRTTNMPRRL